jgi:hypothetical protein
MNFISFLVVYNAFFEQTDANSLKTDRVCLFNLQNQSKKLD